MPTELIEVSLDRVDDHPHNPRIVYRDDVIDAIAASLNGTFPKQHALHVRQVGDRFQIVAGHQRRRAAEKAGLRKIWCWSEKLSDDDAYMLLATSNNQGELSPLEIGLHALRAVPKGKAGRGKKGGLTEYAEAIGKSQGYLSQLVMAAEVVDGKSITQVMDLIDKAKHLCAIHSLPRSAWTSATDWLASHAEASVVDVEERVSRAKEFVKEFKPAKAWADIYPPEECAAVVFCGGRPNEFKELAIIAAEVHATLKEHDDLQEQWFNWLRDNKGHAAWSMKKVQEKRNEIDAERVKRDADPTRELADLRCCTMQELLPTLKNIDAIITDPPYGKDAIKLYRQLAKLAAKALKPDGILAVMCGQSYLPQILAEMAEEIHYRWTMAYLTPGGQAAQLWDREINTFWKPILLFGGSGGWIGDVVKSDVNANEKGHHKWGQSESGMWALVEALTDPGDVVCDPYLGGGTTAVVCVQSGRQFVGCDCDEEAIETTKERLAIVAKERFQF